jgi:hypothetical protein
MIDPLFVGAKGLCSRYEMPLLRAAAMGSINKMAASAPTG